MPGDHDAARDTRQRCISRGSMNLDECDFHFNRAVVRTIAGHALERNACSFFRTKWDHGWKDRGQRAARSVAQRIPLSRIRPPLRQRPRRAAPHRSRGWIDEIILTF